VIGLEDAATKDKIYALLAIGLSYRLASSLKFGSFGVNYYSWDELAVSALTD
jgi:hypothetical protein